MGSCSKLGYPVRFKDSKYIFDDSKIESHSALTPTYKIPDANKLTEKEKHIYEKDLTLKTHILMEDLQMEVFEILGRYGDRHGYVQADNERQALCMYLMNHDELIDIMLWKAPSGMWKLAEYDAEDFYLFARKIK